MRRRPQPEPDVQPAGEHHEDHDAQPRAARRPNKRGASTQNEAGRAGEVDAEANSSSPACRSGRVRTIKRQHDDSYLAADDREACERRRPARAPRPTGRRPSPVDEAERHEGHEPQRGSPTSDVSAVPVPDLERAVEHRPVDRHVHAQPVVRSRRSARRGKRSPRSPDALDARVHSHAPRRQQSRPGDDGEPACDHARGRHHPRRDASSAALAGGTPAARRTVRRLRARRTTQRSPPRAPRPSPCRQSEHRARGACESRL